jgi:hypothetical protein
MEHSVTQTQIGLFINIVTLFIDELADLFFKRTERKTHTMCVCVCVCVCVCKHTHTSRLISIALYKNNYLRAEISWMDGWMDGWTC